MMSDRRPRAAAITILIIILLLIQKCIQPVRTTLYYYYFKLYSGVRTAHTSTCAVKYAERYCCGARHSCFIQQYNFFFSPSTTRNGGDALSAYRRPTTVSGPYGNGGGGGSGGGTVIIKYYNIIVITSRVIIWILRARSSDRCGATARPLRSYNNKYYNYIIINSFALWPAAHGSTDVFVVYTLYTLLLYFIFIFTFFFFLDGAKNLARPTNSINVKSRSLKNTCNDTRILKSVDIYIRNAYLRP